MPSNRKPRSLRTSGRPTPPSTAAATIPAAETGYSAGCAPVRPAASRAREDKEGLPLLRQRPGWRKLGGLLASTAALLSLSLSGPPPASAHNKFDCKHLAFYRWFSHTHADSPGIKWSRARLSGRNDRTGHYHRWLYRIQYPDQTRVYLRFWVRCPLHPR